MSTFFKKFGIGTLALGIMFSFGAMAVPAHAATAGLTEPQIQSILGLLRAFYADQAVITKVEASLRKATVTH